MIFLQHFRKPTVVIVEVISLLISYFSCDEKASNSLLNKSNRLRIIDFDDLVHKIVIEIKLYIIFTLFIHAKLFKLQHFVETFSWKFMNIFGDRKRKSLLKIKLHVSLTRVEGIVLLIPHFGVPVGKLQHFFHLFR